MRRTLMATLAVVCGGASPLAARAQVAGEARVRADSALAMCLRVGMGEGGARAASHSMDLWRAEVQRAPQDAAAYVGLARSIVQCQLPFSGMADQAALFEESVENLKIAIALQPRGWSAHLTLGLVYAGAPSFLGHAANALAELDLVVNGGIMPTDLPAYADAVAALMGLHSAAGRSAEAEALKVRAKTLFPRDPRFAAPNTGPAASERRPPQAALATVTVVAPSSSAIQRRAGRMLSAIDIVTAPGGTADLAQALQTLPGVTGGSESSDLAIQGGDPLETPMHLSGARVAYAGTFESLNGGLFGVIDPSILTGARVRTAAFGARHGDALSGVVEADAIVMPGGASWRLGANSAGVSASVTRRPRPALGYWASTRLTHTGLLLQAQGRRRDYQSTPRSAELSAGGTMRVGAGTLQVIALREQDSAAPLVSAAGLRAPYDATGKTSVAMLSLRAPGFGPLLALQSHLAFSERASVLEFGPLSRERRWGRWNARTEGDLVVAGAGVLHVGAEAAVVLEATDVRAPSFRAPGFPSTAMVTRRRATHLGVFGEMRSTPADGIAIVSGVRLDQLPGETGISVDPRLGVTVEQGKWLASAAAGVYHQGRFRPSADQLGQDTRTGVPRRADHVALGLEYRGRLSVRTDAYVKQYRDWVDGAPGWQGRCATVVGADAFVTMTGTASTGKLTYSVLRGRMALRDGSTVPTAFDVTRSLVAVGTRRLGTSWEVGGTVRAATGRPFTESLGLASDSGAAEQTVVLGNPNSARLPAYLRLDSRISYYARQGTGRLIVLFVEGLNLGNRGNVSTYGYDASFRNREPIRTFFGRRTLILGVEVRH